MTNAAGASTSQNNNCNKSETAHQVMVTSSQVDDSPINSPELLPAHSVSYHQVSRRLLFNSYHLINLILSLGRNRGCENVVFSDAHSQQALNWCFLCCDRARACTCVCHTHMCALSFFFCFLINFCDSVFMLGFVARLENIPGKNCFQKNTVNNQIAGNSIEYLLGLFTFSG